MCGPWKKYKLFVPAFLAASRIRSKIRGKCDALRGFGQV